MVKRALPEDVDTDVEPASQHQQWGARSQIIQLFRKDVQYSRGMDRLAAEFFKTTHPCRIPQNNFEVTPA